MSYHQGRSSPLFTDPLSFFLKDPSIDIRDRTGPFSKVSIYVKHFEVVRNVKLHRTTYTQHKTKIVKWFSVSYLISI